MRSIERAVAYGKQSSYELCGIIESSPSYLQYPVFLLLAGGAGAFSGFFIANPLTGGVTMAAFAFVHIVTKAIFHRFTEYGKKNIASFPRFSKKRISLISCCVSLQLGMFMLLAVKIVSVQSLVFLFLLSTFFIGILFLIAFFVYLTGKIICQGIKQLKKEHRGNKNADASVCSLE